MSTVGRRSNQVRGWVNFPIEDPRFKNSGEGGMFVRLVVVPENYSASDLPHDEDLDLSMEKYLARKYDQEWMVCCGGDAVVLYDECFLGDDVTPDRTEGDWSSESPAEVFHFPRIAQRNASNEEPRDNWLDPYTSQPYLCAMTIGSTGWSGWNNEEQRSFRCRFENLTEEGKSLYQMIEKLYEGRGKIYLQTWLDT